ncbi:transglycosylase domain-containing protein [Paenibacillus hamazuiensis]|uniref:transglycosylase domain-containing protein n=1 Tax=Paenibacillus hamazuiensis TaxID=2936508 RepID=UPI00200F134F|nr:PBP1A family penicillin-binding protein [Paenibacillus hamazuiensis]
MAEKKQTAVKKPSAKKKKGKKVTAGRVLAWTLVAGALGVIGALGLYATIIFNGNKILAENWDKLDMPEASHVFDVNNNEVTVLYRENRESVTSSEIPKKLGEAFIATEDRRFNQHSGVDFVAIGRAIVKDIVARSAVEGGSTITQQLAKNLFLNSNKTFFRKATEMSIAVALETKFSKDEILERYLNRIFFGNGAYGVKAAAKKYFGISDLNKLELWQMATLAAIPKSPSNYNPIDNPEKSKERRDVVLKLMADQGYITEDERAKASAQEYVPPKDTSNKKDYMAYLDYVIKEASDVYGISEDDLLRNGYKIYTAMDASAQKIMEQTYENPKFFQKDGPEQKIQSAMAIVNNKDGGIVAMVGGRDYVRKGLNRAADPRGARQPGSSFKPLIVYAPALEKGYSPYSKLQDEETTYNGYTPRNYDGVYRGQVDMFEAVKRSINAPAVWLLNEIGIKYATGFVNKLGITLDKQDANLAIALGGLTKGVTPLQMATAYSAFPNQGYLNQSHAIIKIIDDDGTELAAYKPKRTEPVMSAKTAWYMIQLLQGVLEPGGTGTAAKLDRPAAGKTGTTQLDLKGLEKNNRDVWFAGFTPEWSAAVWMGFDKTDTKHYVLPSSGSMPAAIFKEVMSKALAKKPATQFVRPNNVPDLTAPPKAVGDLKAELLEGTNPAVGLTWSPMGDKLSYKVYRKEAKDKDFQLLQTVTTTDMRDLTVAAGSSYEYYVVAFNPENNTDSDKSNVEKIDVPQHGAADPLHPQQPGGAIGPGATPPGTTNPGGVPGTTPGGQTPGTTNGGAKTNGPGTGAGNAPGTGGAAGGTAPGTSPVPGGTGTGQTAPGAGGTGSGAQNGGGPGTGTPGGTGAGATPKPAGGATPAPGGAGGSATPAPGGTGGGATAPAAGTPAGNTPAPAGSPAPGSGGTGAIGPGAANPGTPVVTQPAR